MPARTLLEVVQLSAGYLKEHGSDSPRLDAELLMAKVLGLRRLDLYLQFDRPLSDTEIQCMRELVRRRAQHEPIAYILNKKEFYGRSFAVDSRVLIPRPETELLVEKALAYARTLPHAPRIADLGTGSGCLAVTLACELPQATVVAVDISPGAVAVAQQNSSLHGVDERVSVRQQRWTPDIGSGEFDVVVSNPPYVAALEMNDLAPDVRDFEPEIALSSGPDGSEAYAEIIPVALKLLRPRGWLGMEIDPRRCQQVVELMRQHLPEAEIEVVPDLAGRDRVVSALRPG